MQSKGQRMVKKPVGFEQALGGLGFCLEMGAYKNKGLGPGKGGSLCISKVQFALAPMLRGLAAQAACEFVAKAHLSGLGQSVGLTGGSWNNVSMEDERQSESSCVSKIGLERIGSQLDAGGKRRVRDDFKVFGPNSWMEIPL